MVYVFGDCRLDLRTRELAKAEELRHLSPKAFELLRLLIEARPRVIPKAELMDRLWPETFVADANLPVLIGEVRSALGDEARDSRYIRTHHTIGYAFSGVARELRGETLDGELVPMFLTVAERRVALHAGANSIGRDTVSDIRLGDLSVSKHHARITASTTGAVLEDLSSKNGTRVDGALVTAAVALTHGAVITFGSVDVTFTMGRSDDSSTLTLPA